MKRLIKDTIFAGILISLMFIGIADNTIKKQTKDKTYNNCVEIPANKVGLLLGTSKYLPSGKLNLYFQYRIDAATKLYRSCKIEKIVISGDNSRKDYNEPEDMKNDLISHGVSGSDIYLDYAGFRTFDSIYRMNAIFGQKSFTVISQEFHNQRAIYIAISLGLNAVGYNAQNVDVYQGFKTNLREKLSRVNVFLDIVFNKKPKFLGEKVVIE